MTTFFDPRISFKSCCFSSFLIILSKYYQQVSESTQDTLWPHPSSLLANYHWQKNVTEIDLKVGKNKTLMWTTVFCTTENPRCIKCLPLYLQRLASTIAWRCITYFIPKNEWLLCQNVLLKKQKTQKTTN